MTSYNTGTTANSGGGQNASQAIVIPGGVLAGDVVFLHAQAFTTVTSGSTLSVASTGPTSWAAAQVGTTQFTTGGSIGLNGAVWAITAAAGDIGATLTVSSTNNAFWAVAVASYTGASLPVDVQGGAGNNGSITTVTCPNETTGVAGDWAVYFGGGGIGTGATLTGPASTSSRQNVNSSSGIGAGIYDSNGSVGGSGTGIGGGTFTTSNVGTNWMTGFTVGLSPAGGGAAPPAASAVARPGKSWLRRYHHRQIPAWTAPSAPVAPFAGAATVLAAAPQPSTAVVVNAGVATVAAAATPASQGIYRLWPGTNGPASASANSGNFIAGVTFCVTGEAWFEGYWWWVAASGGQSTAATKCALWQATGASVTNSWSVVPGSVVTSGTLTAGQWNYIPLATPIALSLGGSPGMTPPVSGWGAAVYLAAITANGGPFPDTPNYWGTGDPGANGITNGPLTAYSAQSGSMGYPTGMGTITATSAQGLFSTAGTDPSLHVPDSATGTDNFWVDVQVANFSQVTAGTALRLWPGLPNPNYAANGDNTVAVSATAFTLSQSCKLSKIIMFSSPGSTGLPTRCGIWNTGSGTIVSGADVTSPSWLDYGTGSAASAGDGWVYVDMTTANVTLAAGNYATSFFNGAGKLLYYDTPNYFFSGTDPKGGGTVGGPAHAGISWGGGVLTAPNVAGGPSVAYDDSSGTFAGQSIYLPGPTAWAYPGEFEATGDWGETRWADVEVLPPGGGTTATAGVAAVSVVAPAPSTALAVTAGVAAAAAVAPAAAVAETATAAVAAVLAAAPAPSVAVVASAGVAVVLAADPGATVSTSSNATATAGVATVLAFAPAPSVAETATAGVAVVQVASPAPSAADTATAGVATATAIAAPPVPAVVAVAGVAAVLAADPGATVNTSGSTNAVAAPAVVLAIAAAPSPSIVVFAGVATVQAVATAATAGSGKAATAGVATVSSLALAAASFTVTATAQAAMALAAGVDVPPVFTLGTLTAADGPTATLTASDTRTGGPS